jgi:hypothetical protein
MRVYKGAHTGELVMANCKTGLRVVRGLDTTGYRGCTTVGCACSSDDIRFVRATEEETEGFWRSMNSSASEALEAVQGNW